MSIGRSAAKAKHSHCSAKAPDNAGGKWGAFGVEALESVWVNVSWGMGFLAQRLLLFGRLRSRRASNFSPLRVFVSKGLVGDMRKTRFERVQSLACRRN